MGFFDFRSYQYDNLLSYSNYSAYDGDISGACLHNNKMVLMPANSRLMKLINQDFSATLRNTVLPSTPRNICSNGTRIFCSSGNHVYYTDDEGVSYTQSITGGDASTGAIACNDSTVVVCTATTVRCSTDNGITWNPTIGLGGYVYPITPSTNFFQVPDILKFVPELGLFVLVGRNAANNGFILTSPDGINWDGSALIGTDWISSALFYGNKFYLFPARGQGMGKIFTVNRDFSQLINIPSSSDQFNINSQSMLFNSSGILGGVPCGVVGRTATVSVYRLNINGNYFQQVPAPQPAGGTTTNGNFALSFFGNFFTQQNGALYTNMRIS